MDTVSYTHLDVYKRQAHCKDGPNFTLVEQMAAALPCPVIAEGRIHTPQQARQMLEIGAWAVVVGGAITRDVYKRQGEESFDHWDQYVEQINSMGAERLCEIVNQAYLRSQQFTAAQ